MRSTVLQRQPMRCTYVITGFFFQGGGLTPGDDRDCAPAVLNTSEKRLTALVKLTLLNSFIWVGGRGKKTPRNVNDRSVIIIIIIIAITRIPRFDIIITGCRRRIANNDQKNKIK